MRDPNRIDLLLAKLGEAWKKYPDLQFGQFLTNFFGVCQQDIWQTEDDEWMVGLQAFIDGGKPNEAMDAYFHQKYPETPHGRWECPCCGKKYREKEADQFDECPNCGLELTED